MNETLQAIVGLEVEHSVVIQRDGRVFHAVGTRDSVTLEGADLDGAIVMHNHVLFYGEPCSFGKDDCVTLRENPKITLLMACSCGYRYEMKAGPKISKCGYADGEKRVPIAAAGEDDYQHLIMGELDELGAIRYRRKDL